MLRRGLGLKVAIALVVLTGVYPLPALASMVTIKSISNNAVDDSHARVAEPDVVYQRGTGPDAEIRLYDGVSGRNLTSNAVEDREPWISGSRVIWKRTLDGIDCSLRYHDGAPLVLDSAFDCGNDIRIAGQHVVWVDVGPGGSDDVFLWSDTGPALRLGDPNAIDERPRVSHAGGVPKVIWAGDGLRYYDGQSAPFLLMTGEIVDLDLDGAHAVWSAFDGNDDEIFYFDGASTLIQLTDNSYPDGEPRVAAGHVVWTASPGGDTEIAWWNGAISVPVTNDDDDDSAPRISIGSYGPTIAWVSDDGDGEIDFYDGCEVTRLTDNTVDDDEPSLSGDTVSWVRSHAEDDDIYVATVRCDPVCGDGEAEAGEECDDGNTTPGDGCSELCLSEVCGNGRVDFGEGCDDGNLDADDGCDALCRVECGNGVLDTAEECDDGNVTPGDGCSEQCLEEICGNARVDFAEECDDGNLLGDDGCDAGCLLECGNGGIDGAEECDDGNTEPGDGCSPLCTVEVCGNAIVDFGEGCDDGNLLPGDGCDATCQPEEPPSAAQRGCVNELNKRGAAVVKAQGKLGRSCLESASKGKVAKLGVPPTAQDCLTNDPKGAVAKALAKTTSGEAKKCEALDLPDFGYTGAAATNAAGAAEALGVVADLFGADLTAAVIPDDTDRTGARCQWEVARRTTALVDTLFKAARQEKKKALKGSGGVVQAFSGVQLQAVLTAAVDGDAQGKIAKKTAQLSQGIAKRCSGGGLAAAFPGCAPADANALEGCATAAARCRFCRALNAFDLLSIDCDAMDDSVSNTSCP